MAGAVDELASNELPDTQPTNSQEIGLLAEPVVYENVWGSLFPLSLEGERSYNLNGDKYSVGRSPECDITLSENEVDKKHFLLISKVQFTIEKHILDSGHVIINITDHSTNGTYVNGNKIGKNNKRILSNNDIISIAYRNNKMFIFADFLPSNDGIPDEIKRQYAILNVIGKGGFGEVRLVYKKETAKQYAMKIMEQQWEGSLKRDIFDEVVILYKINHDNVVKLHDIMRMDNKIFMFMELMQGGDLAHRLIKSTKFSESVTKHIFYQLLLGVHHLHENNIIHRDLKPANVLLSSDSEYPVVKISDFGVSKFLTHSITHLHTICGTPHFSAPELMYYIPGSTYSNKADIWSLGVLLFVCLSGQLPFSKQRTDMPFEEQIKTAAFTFANEKWKHIHTEVKRIISTMIAKDPCKRLSAYELLSHRWIQEDEYMKSRVRNTNDTYKENYYPPTKKFCSPTRIVGKLK